MNRNRKKVAAATLAAGNGSSFKCRNRDGSSADRKQ